LQRVTSSWTETTLTWNNQPTATTTDQVILPQSTSGTQDYLNNDVTAMVQQMVSGTNNGFRLRLTNETYYAQMFFASGDNPHLDKHPQLQVCYSLPAGITETANENDITVFPIPAKDELTLIAAQTTHNAIVEMYNDLGEKIKSWNIKAGTKELKINTSLFEAGIYFVKVFDGDRYSRKKIIIEHD
jgi:hypothetical protein